MPNNGDESNRFVHCPQMGVEATGNQGQAMKLTGSYLAIVMRQARITRP